MTRVEAETESDAHEASRVVERWSGAAQLPERFATLLRIRKRGSAFEVLLGFGGEMENTLLCGCFATLSRAQAAAPKLAERFTDPRRVASRCHRSLCVGRAGEHGVEDCPLCPQPIWRWLAARTPAPQRSPVRGRMAA